MESSRSSHQTFAPMPLVHLGKWKIRLMAVTDGVSPVPGPVLDTECVQSVWSSSPLKMRATISTTFGDGKLTITKEGEATWRRAHS